MELMHRPAAAAKPKAKAAARVRVPGGRGVPRRPAGRAPAVEPVAIDSLGDRFERGEDIELEQLPLGLLKVGVLLAFDSGVYFGGPCQFAGRFRELIHSGGQSRLRILVTGTTHEDLLRFITGSTDRLVEVHLCGKDCSNEPHDQGLLHSKLGRKIPAEKEKDCTWETNVNVEVHDELADLRRVQVLHQGGAEGGLKADHKKKEDEKSSSSSKKGKKRKKDKKKKAEKAKKKPKKEGEGEKNDEEKEKHKRSYGGRTIAKKSLSLIYSGTGLDPRPSVRRRVIRYAKKKVSKKKESSSSSTSSSSESEEGSSGEEADALADQNKIKLLSRFAPGSLSAMGVLKMQEALTEQEGIWQMQESSKSLPAVALRYTRMTLGSRLSGGALKEALTLAASIDLALQGRVAEAVDVQMQRLKSMERVAQGASWSSAEKMELTPHLNPQISTRQEVEAANREMKLDLKTKNLPPQSFGTKGYGKGKKGKTDDKSNSKGKGKKNDANKGNQTTTTG